MALDSALAQEQLLTDRSVRETLRDQAQDLTLPLGELLERASFGMPAKELGDHLGINGRAALSHALEGVEELAEVGDAILEQIADPGWVRRQEADGVVRLQVVRQDKHPHVRMALADHQRGE